MSIDTDQISTKTDNDTIIANSLCRNCAALVASRPFIEYVLVRRYHCDYVSFLTTLMLLLMLLLVVHISNANSASILTEHNEFQPYEAAEQNISTFLN